MDAFLLARIQFAANISFHILFPSITIALCWILFFFKVRYDLTRDEKWIEAYKFWVKIFALCFALGVVSGITMSFQFGTNWPGFMKSVGNVAGPLLGYEVLSAFFLEATFLAVMLFGREKVSNFVHTLSTFLVALGTSLSAFWIIALNSWMQHPVGHKIIDGVVHAENWLDIVFNPTMPYMFVHVLLSSGLTASFLVAGVSAYVLLRNKDSIIGIIGLKTGVYLAAILIPFQIFVGDLHGLHTLKIQPAKIAAMEGVWETEKNVPLLLFAIPDEKERKNKFEIGIPYGASLILTHSLDGEIQGLNEFKGKHPPVKSVFYSFRIMVGVGILMLLISWYSSYQLLRYGSLSIFSKKSHILMTFSGWVATVAGWFVTEIGRQPYLVYDLLTTFDARSDVPPSMILSSLIMYLSIYLFLIISFIYTLFFLARKNSGTIDPSDIEDENHNAKFDKKMELKENV